MWSQRWSFLCQKEKKWKQKKEKVIIEAEASSFSFVFISLFEKERRESLQLMLIDGRNKEKRNVCKLIRHFLKKIEFAFLFFIMRSSIKLSLIVFFKENDEMKAEEKNKIIKEKDERNLWFLFFFINNLFFFSSFAFISFLLIRSVSVMLFLVLAGLKTEPQLTAKETTRSDASFFKRKGKGISENDDLTNELFLQKSLISIIRESSIFLFLFILLKTSLLWTIWPDQRIETKPRERSKGQRVALLGFNPSGQYAFI